MVSVVIVMFKEVLILVSSLRMVKYSWEDMWLRGIMEPLFIVRVMEHNRLVIT